jgi:hypothetical protein
VRPDLGDGQRRVDEAAMVAAHDRDPVALAEALVGERVGKRVRAGLHLGEAERAHLVDERGLVPAGDRAGDDPGRRAGAPPG